MKILIDIGHPGHVHFFRNFMKIAEKKGHEFKVVARERECVLDLLRYYKIPFVKRKGYKSLFGKIKGLFTINYKLYRIAKKFKPDLFMGISSPYAAHVAWFFGKKSFIFTDTEHAKEQHKIFMPFCTKVVVPSCFTGKFSKKKEIRYNSYHELAYLHSNYFKPNTKVLDELGLKEKDKFFIIRFVSWDASHDRGHKGLKLSDKKKIIELLKGKGKILISSETPLQGGFEKYRISVLPEKILDLLNYATMYIGEGGTMASESSVLGTPAIYTNPLCMGYISEEEKKYGLLFQSTKFLEIETKIIELLGNKNLKKEFKEKQKKLLNDKIDLTEWMLNFVFSKLSK